jgi:hypothetical protein
MKKQGWRAGTIGGFGILAAWFLACAGEDTPPVDDVLRGALVQNFGGQDGQLGVAGAAGGDLGGAAGSGGGGGGTPPPSRGGSGGSGSPVGGGGSGSGNADVCNAYETIFIRSCVGSNCHEDGSINGAFAGDNPPLAADLVDVVSSRGEECGVLVDSRDSANSLILQMVAGTQGGSCFPVQMPLSGDNLTPDELDCVEDWLTQFED